MFLCSYPDDTVQQTAEFSVIWDLILIMWRHPKILLQHGYSDLISLGF